ncbi:MAG: phosphatidate cytidylyltransferase [Candidatus Aminicenantes bacterium]|nr:phosphatidate cytidylyltransferase [Candidatus Aminicenantes bacterium]
MKEFFTRTLTALVIIPIVYLAIQFLPLLVFSLFVYIIISRVAYEFINLCNPRLYSFPLILAAGLVMGLSFALEVPDLKLFMMAVIIGLGLFFLFSINRREDLASFVRDMGIHFMVVFYIYFPLYFLVELKKAGANTLFFLILVIIIGDSGAYFIGSWIGKRAIYPVASPNKTLAGLIAAILTASLAGWLSLVIFPVAIKPWMAMISGGLIGLVSQLSDPIESLFKRAVLKKDSGSILPGHGGFLDRLDSYIFCSPLLVFLVKYFWKL